VTKLDRLKKRAYEARAVDDYTQVAVKAAGKHWLSLIKAGTATRAAAAYAEAAVKEAELEEGDEE